jgi:DNA-directed RNA polymerase specialized sigma24 family protein
VETDGALMEWSVRGRADAFVEVVRRHEVAVHGFLVRRAGRQAADDLLGEVWVRAFAARAGFQPGSADARPWLYGIARNVLRAHWMATASAEPPAAATALEGQNDPWDDVVERYTPAIVSRRDLPSGESYDVQGIAGTARSLSRGSRMHETGGGSR